MNIKWSDAEKGFVRDNACRLKDIEIAKELTARSGRQITLHSVRKMRQKLGIKKLSGRGRCGVVNQGGEPVNDPVPTTTYPVDQLVHS